MITDLNISLIQTFLHWEDIEQNLAHFDRLIDDIENSDLIVLPETFSTAFSMNSEELSEEMNGSAMQWMQQKAKQKNAVLCGSLILKEEEKIYNRCIWMRPDGTFDQYDKRHLFRMGEEHQFFTSGQERLIVDLKGWKICPLICYDLRFPVWSRNNFHIHDDQSVEAAYDLLIYMANWPEVRVTAWQKLLYARAIENQCYVAAVNRIGEDGLGVNCSGSSMVIDFKGELAWQANDQEEVVKTLTISKEALEKFRMKFPVGLDADQFTVL